MTRSRESSIMTHSIITTPNFVTSDWHIGHENVIAYDRRPFRSIDHMRQMLIHNFNSVVSEDSHTLVLGDTFFKATREEATDIMAAMNGTKALIRGNHDRRSRKWYLDVGFASVLDYYEYYDVCVGKIALVHNPLNAIAARYVIHGHKHSTQPDTSVGGIRRVDVSVTAWDYRPAPFVKVIDLLRGV
jgi:calcineurin-like phosphoesterase family protein